MELSSLTNDDSLSMISLITCKQSYFDYKCNQFAANDKVDIRFQSDPSLDSQSTRTQHTYHFSVVQVILLLIQTRLHPLTRIMIAAVIAA